MGGIFHGRANKIGGGEVGMMKRGVYDDSPSEMVRMWEEGGGW